MRSPTLLASLAVALCTAAPGQVVITMPPPPPATTSSAAAPPAAVAPAPAVPAARQAPTTYESEFARRRSAEPVQPGALALARYAGARSAPDYSDAAAGPLGGWVAGYGYYRYLGYQSDWGGPSWNWRGWGPGWGWGSGWPCWPWGWSLRCF